MNTELKRASAGTLESSDAMVELEPAQTREIELQSVVEQQFGDSIRALAAQMLDELNVPGAHLRIVDRGALECVLRARIETAVRRAKGEM